MRRARYRTAVQAASPGRRYPGSTLPSQAGGAALDAVDDEEIYRELAQELFTAFAVQQIHVSRGERAATVLCHAPEAGRA